MEQEPNVIAGFLPIVILGLFWALVCLPIARRKTNNSVLWFILCAIPLVNFWAIPTLLGKTDKSVLQRIEDLEKSHK